MSEVKFKPGDRVRVVNLPAGVKTVKVGEILTVSKTYEHAHRQAPVYGFIEYPGLGLLQRRLEKIEPVTRGPRFNLGDRVRVVSLPPDVRSVRVGDIVTISGIEHGLRDTWPLYCITTPTMGFEIGLFEFRFEPLEPAKDVTIACGRPYHRKRRVRSKGNPEFRFRHAPSGNMLARGASIARRLESEVPSGIYHGILAAALSRNTAHEVFFVLDLGRNMPTEERVALAKRFEHLAWLIKRQLEEESILTFA